MPQNLEIVGSNPSGFWAFLFFSLNPYWCIPQVGAALLILTNMLSSAASGEIGLVNTHKLEHLKLCSTIDNYYKGDIKCRVISTRSWVKDQAGAKIIPS